MANNDAGVMLAGTGQKIQNNTIYASARFAIFPNTVPYYPPIPESNDDISYNNLYNAMMLSRDGGEIYVGGDDVTGTEIHLNWLHDTQSLLTGPADNYALPGVYIDEDSSGFEVDQNIVWNSGSYDIFVNGSNDGRTNPNNNNVHNNTIPDVGATASIDLGTPGTAITSCGTTQIVNNLVLVPVVQSSADQICTATNNSATAPGATDMTASVQVGCNFTGCPSSGPPAISGTSVAASIATQPYGVTVSVGQTATFSVTGAGSPPLTFQWQRNGVNINGATAATYTTPAIAAVDSGAVFTVQVNNSLGTVTSTGAVLTVD
jgi:hypothetical protein